jgi:hypothetical protein
MPLSPGDVARSASRGFEFEAQRDIDRSTTLTAHRSPTRAIDAAHEHGVVQRVVLSNLTRQVHHVCREGSMT